MRYIVSFSLYCLSFLPWFLQRRKTEKYVQSLLNPLQVFNNEFVVYVKDTVYLTSFTGQVIYLEHILNDLYDSIDRSIFISDGNQLPLPPYIYNKIEARPRFVYNKAEASLNKTYLHNKLEYALTYDFIVNTPVVISALDLQVSGIVRRYKIAGKRFTIDHF